MNTDDLQSSSDHNIFQMSVANGGPGFWVRRTTWAGTCARIIGVGPMTKPAPYYGNPPVVMDVYGLGGQLREGLARVPVPGTCKTWRRIETPSWASRGDLRPLDDPAIDIALKRLDRRRDMWSSPASQNAEGVARVRLSVPFSRKDEAKRIGARWSPSERTWWLPAHDVSALSKAQVLGLLSEKEANDRTNHAD